MYFLFGLKVMCAIKNDPSREHWGEVEAAPRAGAGSKRNQVEGTAIKQRNAGFGGTPQKLKCLGIL